jgi:hypothetical protein
VALAGRKIHRRAAESTKKKWILATALVVAVKETRGLGDLVNGRLGDRVIERPGRRREEVRAAPARRCVRCGGPVADGDICQACREFFRRLRGRRRPSWNRGWQT